jgi:hypothetical protein
MPSVPAKGKKKRNWILYAAGAGALLGLLVLLLKSKKSSEGEAVPLTTAAEGIGGASSGEGGVFTNALSAFETENKRELEATRTASMEESSALAKANQEGLTTLSASLAAGLSSLAATQQQLEGSLESQYNELAANQSAVTAASTSSAGSPVPSVTPPSVVSVKPQPSSGSGKNTEAGNPRAGLSYTTKTVKGKTVHVYATAVPGGVGAKKNEIYL